MSVTADPPFRWAILGTGPVSRKFAYGLRSLGPSVTVAAVASRRLANARSFAADFGVPFATEDIGAAVGAGVDAVYVATPPSEHEAHALAAIAAGRHVLVEKPFASDVRAARAIAEAADGARVFCMEAMWTRFLPIIGAIRARLDSGALGEVRGFDGAFYGAARPEPARSLFDPDRGGGALRHRGVYPLSLARLFCGPILEVRASGRIGETGVDEDCALILRHASGALSTIRASLRSDGESAASLFGTAGTILVRAPIYRPIRAEFRPAHPEGGATRAKRFEALRETPIAQRLNDSIAAPARAWLRQPQTLRGPIEANGYQYEAKALMAAVAEGLFQSPVMPLSESIEIAEVIEDALTQIRKGAAT